jgi:8-oxo-dGTP pyrophosphatase MutT (NUDIX family)
MGNIYRGSIIIFYKQDNDERRYLVVENTKTNNISFVSGAKEESDRTIETCAQREITEELSLTPSQYQLQPTAITHDFVFGPNKPERAGQPGSYSVFLVDASTIEEIGHTAELKAIQWLTKEEVLTTLVFPDLKAVFERAIQEIMTL